jgi:rod shape-determining protein MreD
MVPFLVGIPVLAVLVMVQSGIISQTPLLHGTADIVLLAVTAWALHDRVKTGWQWAVTGGLLIGWVSGLPFGVYLVCYLAVVAMCMLIKRRVWKIPLLAMLLVTFTGTLVLQGASYLALTVTGVSLPVLASINLVVLPSILLNLLLAVPFYVLVSDLANWLHPVELEA